jgi:hypothetical protein
MTTTPTPEAMAEALKAADMALMDKCCGACSSDCDMDKPYIRQALDAYEKQKDTHVWVPREPSVSMRHAGMEADDKRTGNETCAHIYKAMISAAEVKG